ncbi:MAG: DinB family protein [Dehalococcoidia bacterium]
MTRAGIEQLLYLMDEAFKDNPFHSLLANLRSVDEKDWEWLPDGASRTILHIVQHVGGAKTWYENHAFGEGSLTWDDPSIVPQESAPAVMIDWLRASHQRWRSSVASLEDDSELARNRKAPWGTDAQTRWLINNMIQHDLYHAGEINHLRALHQRNDE